MTAKRCYCKEVGREPYIRKQPSLKEGVIVELVCFRCGFWHPLVKDSRS